MKRIITLVLAICILFSLSACGRNNTAEKVAADFVLACYTGDPEKLVDTVPEFMLREMARSYGLSEDDKKGLINLMKSNISEEDLSDCDIISSVKSDDTSLLYEYKENMDNYQVTNQDLARIEEYCMVNVEAMVDGDNVENIVFCVKYDGKWCAVDID